MKKTSKPKVMLFPSLEDKEKHALDSLEDSFLSYISYYSSYSDDDEFYSVFVLGMHCEMTYIQTRLKMN